MKTIIPPLVDFSSNLAKSFGYVAIDVFGEMNPTVKGYVEANQELLRSAYESAKDIKGLAAHLKETVYNSDVGTFGREYVNNFIKDMRSGKLYNKERESKAYSKMYSGGNEDDDWNDIFKELDNIDNDEVWKRNMNFDDDDEEERDPILTNRKEIIAALDNNALMVSTAINQSAEISAIHMAKENRQNTRAKINSQAAFHERLARMVNSMNSSLAITSSLVKPLESHMQNSQRFYTTMTDIGQKTYDVLGQIATNTGSIATMQQVKEKERFGYNDIVSGGIVDAGGYLKAVAKNIDDSLGSIKALNSAFGEGTSMLSTFAASPIKPFVEMAVKSAVPKGLAKLMQEANESLNGLFGSTLMKIGGLQNNDNEPEIFKKIAKVFELRNPYKTSIDTNLYERGRVNFDGVTRKAIVEVIPTQLSKIVSLLSGESETRYNYEQGRFQTLDEIKRQRDDLEKDYASRASADIRREFDKYLNVFNYRDYDQKQRINNEIDNFFTRLYKDSKLFNYNDRNAMASDYDVSNETFSILKALYKAAEENGKGHLALQLNDRILRERQNQSNFLTEQERSGNSIWTSLYNGSVSNSKYTSDKYIDERKSLFNRLAIDSILDDKGHNVFYYLQHYYVSFNRLLGAIGAYNPSSNPLGGMETYQPRSHPGFYPYNYFREDLRYSVPISSRPKTMKEQEYDNLKRERDYYRENKENRIEKWKRKGTNYVDLSEMYGMSDEEFELGVRNALNSNNRADRLEEELQINKNSRTAKLFDRLRKLSANEKFAAVMNRGQELVQYPSKRIKSIYDSVNKKLYQFIYGNGAKDERSFMDKMMNRLSDTFIHFNTFLDEKILDPLAQKYDIHNFSDMVYKIFDKVGIDMRSIIGETKDRLFGIEGSDGRKGGLLKEIGDNVKETFRSTFDWVKDGFKGIFGPLVDNVRDRWNSFRDAHKSNKSSDKEDSNEEGVRRIDQKIKEAADNVYNGGRVPTTEGQRIAQLIADKYKETIDNISIPSNPFDHNAGARFLEDYTKTEEGRFALAKALASINLSTDINKYKRNTNPDPEYNDPINRLRTKNFKSQQSRFGETDEYTKLNAIFNDPLSKRSVKFFEALKNSTKTPVELRENQNLLIELTTKENFKYIKEHWDELMPNAGNIMQVGGDEYIKSVLADNIDYIKQNKDKFIKSARQELSILGTFDQARQESENIGKSIYDENHGSLLSKLNTMIDNQNKQIDILNKLGSVNVKISEYTRGIGLILRNFPNGFNPNNTRFGIGTNGLNNDIYDQDIQDADVRDITPSTDIHLNDIINNSKLLALPEPGVTSAGGRREEEIDSNKRINDIIYDNTKQEKIDRELIKFFTDDIYDQYYRGGEVKRTGIAAVSKGELIIPSELNPFYNGPTNKEQQKRDEDNAILQFFGKFAEGTTSVGDKNASKIGARGLASIEKQNYTEAEYNNILSKVLSGKYVLVSEDKVAKSISRLDNTVINKLGYSPAIDEDGNIVDDNYRDLMIDRLLSGDPSVKLRSSRFMKLLNGGKTPGFKAKYIEEGSTMDKILDRANYTMNRLFGDPKKAEQENSKLRDITNDLIANSSQYAGSALAGGLIGGGVSLLTGMVGGPLLGAAIGGATALTLKSKALNTALFGELSDDGIYRGGALGDNISTFIKTKFPGIAKGGAVGAITSLMPFVPGGPIAGLMVGSAIGYAKQSEDFKGFFFGEEGLFGKDTDKKIKEKLPAMGIGAAGGAFFGPFGFLGNLILGAGIGFASDTDQFKNLIYGRKNDKGERVGGIVGAVREGVIDPLKNWGKDTIFTTRDYLRDHVLKPLGTAIKPITRQISLSIEGMFTGISDRFNNWLNNTLGMPITTTMGKILKKLTVGSTKLANTLFAPVKLIGSFPFRLLGRVGTHYQKGQIKSGTANYMDAAERMQFRRTHKMGKNDKYSQFDSVLQNMNKNDLTEMNSILSNIGKNNNLEKEAHNISKEVANTLTDEIGYRSTRSAMDNFNNGDASALLATIQYSSLSDERKAELYKYVQAQHDRRKDMLSAARQGETVTSKATKSLRRMGFKNFNENSLKGSNLSHIQQLIEKEMNSKRLKDPTEVRVEQGKAELDILKKLNESIDAIRAATDPKSDFARAYNNSRKRRNSENKVKFETDYRGNVHKYVVNKEGEYEEDTTDTDTRRARDEIDEADRRDEDIVRNTGILAKIHNMFSGVSDWVFGKKQEDTEDGILKRMGRIAKGLTKIGLLTTGVGFAGAGAKYFTFNILPIIKEWWREDFKPYLQNDLPYQFHNVWIPKLENSALGQAVMKIPEIINRVAEAVGNGFGYIKNTAIPWILGYGQYQGQGLPSYIGQALAWAVPTMLEGFTFAFETAGPAIVKSLIVTLPRLFKALATSIGSVLFSGVNNIFNNKKDIDISSAQIFDKVSRVDGFSRKPVKGSRLNEYISDTSIPSLSSIADSALSSLGIGSSTITSLNDTMAGISNTGISTNISPNTISTTGSINDLVTGVTTAGLNHITGGNKLIIPSRTSTNNTFNDEDKSIIQNQLLSQGFDPLSAKSIAYGSKSEIELQNNIKSYYNTNFGINDNMSVQEQEDAIQTAYANGYDSSNNIVKGYNQSLFGTALEAGVRSLAAPQSIQKGMRFVGAGAKGIISLADLTARGLSHVPFIKKPFKAASAATGFIQKIANPIIDIATDSPSLIAKSLTKLDNVANNITKTQTTANLLNKFVNNGALSGKEGLEKVSKIFKNNALKTNSMVAKIISAITDGVKKLMDCKQVQKVIRQITGKNADDVLKLCVKAAGKISSALGNLVKKAATGASGLISKAFNAISGKVFFFVMLAADFISGMDRAESILGVTDPNLIETLIAGLVNAVTNQLTFGIIPTSSVVDVFVDTLLPMLNIDMSDLQQRREDAEQALYEWNASHPDEQYDNMDDFLKKDDISTKIRNASNKVWSSIKSAFGQDDSSISVSNSHVVTSKASNIGANLISNNIGNGSGIRNIDNIRGTFYEQPPIMKRLSPILSGGDSELENNNNNTIAANKTTTLKESVINDLLNKLIDIISGFLQTNVVYNTIRNILGSRANKKKVADVINKAIDKLALLLRKEITHISSYSIRGGLSKLDNFLDFLGKKAFFWLDMALAFASGMDKAETILGFEQPGIVWTFIAGCINAFSELTAGFLSSETLADILIEVFMPLFGINTEELQQKRADAEKAFIEWNKTHPDNQYATMGDYLSRNDISTKIKNTVGKFFGGGSFVSQFDPRFAGKSFGGSNIAKEGCGPAVATMAINDITGRNINLGNAANYATIKGYTGSGTHIGYFKDIFASQGIPSSYVNNKNDIMGALSRGHETVLLGRDASNRSKQNSPFGPGSHYVLAKGLTPNGDIVVNDPESSLPNRIYKKSILDNVQMGVAAAGSGSMLQEAIAQISKYEGNHASVNKNDVGALSIGKIQWHGVRARNLLREIEKAQPGILENYLSSELANAVNTKDDYYWDHRILTSSEASAMKQLLGTTTSINTQNQLVAKDVASYFNYPQSRGITDPGALAAIADATNTAYAVGQRVADNAIKLAGSPDAVNIEHVYQAIKNDSVASRAIYADRYASMYQKMRNMTSFEYDPEMDRQLGINTINSVGGLTTTVGVHNTGGVIGGNNTENTASTNSTNQTSNSNSLLSLFGKLANSILNELYGSTVISTIADFLGINLPNTGTPSTVINPGLINTDLGYATSIASTPIGDITDRSSSALLNLYKNTNVKYGDLVAETAKSYVDQVDYVYGARDIDNKMQADCSGFTQQIYKKFGYSDMQPTVTTQDADSRFQRIYSRSDLLPGDLVMIENDDNTANGCDHIGIYVGDGKFVHSPKTGFKVKISDLNTDYYNKHFDHGKRVPVPEDWTMERNNANAQQGVSINDNNTSNYFDTLVPQQTNNTIGNGSGIIDPLQHYIKTSEQNNTPVNIPEIISQDQNSSMISLLESILNKLDNIANNTFPINNIINILERIVSLKKSIGSGSKVSDDVTTNLINKNYIINNGNQNNNTDNSDINRLTSLIGELIL